MKRLFDEFGARSYHFIYMNTEFWYDQLIFLAWAGSLANQLPYQIAPESWEAMMKLKKLAYHNKELAWRLQSTEFSDLNLLVGASGAGKTRILEAILDLQKIARGESENGVVWDVEISVEGIDYRWSGEFENSSTNGDFIEVLIEGDNGESSKKSARIICERLSSQGTKIVERKHSEIEFKGAKLPVKLSASSSVVKLFNEDESISPIYQAFVNQIIQSKPDKNNFYGYIVPALLKEYHTLQAIQNNNLGTLTKLALCHENFPDLFNLIKERFIDIFPQVQDMTIKRKPGRGLTVKWGDFEELPATEVILYVREDGVENWIRHDLLSSGMLKSLIFIADMYLCAEGTVVLIDEFENSLGVNCIDIIDDLLFENKNLQYIITSHHPYIINNVPMAHWKIVTRNKSVVSVKNANKFKLGKSKHEAFMQLMQLEEFTQGISSA